MDRSKSMLACKVIHARKQHPHAFGRNNSVSMSLSETTSTQFQIVPNSGMKNHLTTYD